MKVDNGSWFSFCFYRGGAAIDPATQRLRQSWAHEDRGCAQSGLPYHGPEVASRLPVWPPPAKADAAEILPAAILHLMTGDVVQPAICSGTAAHWGRGVTGAAVIGPAAPVLEVRLGVPGPDAHKSRLAVGMAVVDCWGRGRGGDGGGGTCGGGCCGRDRRPNGTADVDLWERPGSIQALDTQLCSSEKPHDREREAPRNPHLGCPGGMPSFGRGRGRGRRRTRWTS